jgi:phosphohistidine phosphatase
MHSRYCDRMASRTLLLVRHAQTEDGRPGHRDEARRLTDQGLEQARALGDYLRSSYAEIDQVLCSTAERARQTVQELGLRTSPQPLDRLYNAGADDIIEVIRELPTSAQVALLVGHAPALGSVAAELADPESSDADAVQILETRFPAGALAVLEVEGDWSELTAVRLISIRLP